MHNIFQGAKTHFPSPTHFWIRKRIPSDTNGVFVFVVVVFVVVVVVVVVVLLSVSFKIP